jgi:N6-L-threonylcarbamoyladenine synthase
MIILGIETSCDETAVAVLQLEKKGKVPTFKILVNLIASQEDVHAPYGGIVPELASRRHIEVLYPMVEKALSQASLPLSKIDGIAVTYAPGLVGSLLVGLSFAKSLAFGLKIPFIGVSHLEGHLNAPFLENTDISYPHIGLIVSGGHTALYLIKKFGAYQFLGGTRDDAAGEAFDKTAKILGLGYPGGPLIDQHSKKGNPKKAKLPKPRLPAYDFSFSGLKSAVKRLVNQERITPLPLTRIQDICASFQEVVVDHLVEKAIEASKKKNCKTILLTGGVACNSRLRQKLEEACKKVGKKLCYPSPSLCTDNGAMIAYTGGRYLLEKKSSPLSLNALANLNLSAVEGKPWA